MQRVRHRERSTKKEKETEKETEKHVKEEPAQDHDAQDHVFHTSHHPLPHPSPPARRVHRSDAQPPFLHLLLLL